MLISSDDLLKKIRAVREAGAGSRKAYFCKNFVHQASFYMRRVGHLGLRMCMSHCGLCQLPWVRTLQVRIKWRTQLDSKVGFRYLCSLTTKG